jgi:hypothetical protein
MPVNLRRTLLLASALQVLGPKHAFTTNMERLLSNSDCSETEDAMLDKLPERDKTALLDRYEIILNDLPVNFAAA